MNNLKLKLDSDNYAPNDHIFVELTWDSLDESEQYIEIYLFWHTEGRGDENMEIVQKETIEITSANGNKTIEFIAPMHPYSFIGKYISLNWNIEAVLTKSEASVANSIIISPSREVIQL